VSSFPPRLGPLRSRPFTPVCALLFKVAVILPLVTRLPLTFARAVFLLLAQSRYEYLVTMRTHLWASILMHVSFSVRWVRRPFWLYSQTTSRLVPFLLGQPGPQFPYRFFDQLAGAKRPRPMRLVSWVRVIVRSDDRSAHSLLESFQHWTMGIPDGHTDAVPSTLRSNVSLSREDSAAPGGLTKGVILSYGW